MALLPPAMRRVQYWKPWSLLLVPLLVVCGLWLWVTVNRLDLRVGPDETAYMSAGFWFAAGQGIVTGELGELKPMTHWPPLYPFSLGTGIMLGATAEQTAFAINCAALGLSLLFVGILTWRLAGSFLWAILAQVLVALSWDFILLHLTVASEPMFFALVLGALCAVLEYERNLRIVWLALASVLLACATMCRFTGLAMTAGVSLYLLWRGKRTAWAAVILFLAVCAPLVAWHFIQPSGNSSARYFAFFRPHRRMLFMGLQTIGRFFDPVDLRPAKYILAPIVPILTLYLTFRRETRLLGCLILVYVAFVGTAMVTFDRFIILDTRMLMPPALFCLIGLSACVAFAVRRWSASPPRKWKSAMLISLCACLGLLIGARAADTIFALRRTPDTGLGFNAVYFRRSATLGALQFLPNDVLVVSQRPEAIHYLTGRSGWLAPDSPPSAIDWKLTRLIAEVKRRPVVYVEVRFFATPHVVLWASQLNPWLDLEPISNQSDGILFYLKPRAEHNPVPSHAAAHTAP